MKGYLWGMEFFDAVNNVLKKPFPEEESRFGAPTVIIAISLFVTLFLYVFQPFGISTLESGKFLICLGFGFMTFATSVVYDFAVTQIFKLIKEREQWTFGKWIIYNLGVMLFISLANFLYARLLLFGFIQWELFPHMMYGTFMIGIIPVVVLGWLSVLKQERKYQNLAAEINRTKTSPSDLDDMQMLAVFDIPLNQIRYVEALQNYVKIGYVNDGGQFKVHTERATLKYILEETAGSTISMSHRSFLVNKQAILSISGNAQGLLLTLADCDTIIPVSRSYVANFRDS